MAALRFISQSELSKHRKAGDLWLAISGNVYDLSCFLTHPGGLGPLCELGGTDATSEFLEQRHGARELRKIERFKLGKLVKEAETIEEEMEDA
jgi:cytochrome b involved in lipid metabolism